MKTAGKILTYQLRDIARNKWVIAYAFVLMILTEALFRLGGDGGRVMGRHGNRIRDLRPFGDGAVF